MNKNKRIDSIAALAGAPNRVKPAIRDVHLATIWQQAWQCQPNAGRICPWEGRNVKSFTAKTLDVTPACLQRHGGG
jgi:hypothetical protein